MAENTTGDRFPERRIILVDGIDSLSDGVEDARHMDVEPVLRTTVFGIDCEDDPAVRYGAAEARREDTSLLPCQFEIVRSLIIEKSWASKLAMILSSAAPDDLLKLCQNLTVVSA
ncbi:hypothetical protein AAE028_02265 [Sinorhizobium sp. CB9]